MTDNKFFEKIIADVHKFLSPNAVIKENQKIMGKSGRMRQIDVLIEDVVSIYPIKIVLDAKLYKHKIDIKEVEEVWGLVDDVEANMGVIVCNSGYTKGAIARAKTYGRLKLCSLLDLENKDFSIGIKIPTVVEMRQPSFRLQINGVGSSTRQIAFPPNSFEWKIRNKRTKVEITIVNFFLQQWNSGNASQETGDHNETVPRDEFDLLDKTGPVDMDVIINYSVIPRYYFGFTPLEEGKGIFDVIEHSLSTKEIKTGEISFEDVEKRWEKYDSLEELLSKHEGINLPRYHIIVSDTFAN